MSVALKESMTREQAWQDLQRRRHALEHEALQPQRWEKLCSLAHQLGELYEEENAFLHPEYARSGRWRMN